MQKVTLPIACLLLLLMVQCSVEAIKTTKQDRGIEFSKTFDGEENGSDKGQRQKIHHEKIVDEPLNDNSTTNGANGAIGSPAGVPLQTPYSPQGGGSGGYGGSAGDSDASIV